MAIIPFIVVLVYSTHGQLLSDYKQLFRDKFQNHLTGVMPRVDASTALGVECTFYYMTLVEFNEISETVVILGGMQMTWNDPDLAWDPSTYAGLTYTTVTNKYVWNPPVTLVNSVDELESLGAGSEYVAFVTFDGNVTIPVGGVLKAKCTTDIFKFPYDTQKCNLQFNVWGYLETDSYFKLSKNPINQDFSTVNSNWELESITASIRSWNGYSNLDVYITIKRQSLYYSVIVICPTILFGLLNPLVFLLPVDSGERIGLAMTILLSYAIFLTIVSAAIPASSNPMSLLLIMMIVTIVASGLIVVKAIVISSIYYREDLSDMNKFWKFIGRRNIKVSKVNPLKVMSKVDLQDCKKKDIYADERITWKDVSSVLDHCSIVFGYTIFISIIIVFFAVAMV